MASRARSAAHRLITPFDRLAHRNSGTLLPPAHLRIYYYRTWRVEAFTRACEIARAEVACHGIQPDHRVLDIGSGIGNLAIALSGFLRGTYDGVEIHPEAVRWCQQAISPVYPAFRFHHADVVSRAYNPHGRLRASEYVFPFADGSFDFIFLASVFTHMLPDDVTHYVGEISRLLAPGGVCVASYLLLNDERRAAVEQRRSFMSFDVRHASGLCRLHDEAVPEAAVALEEAFVERIHEAAGLRIRDVRRGRWWSGEADDQDVLAVVRK